jgi:hypothetical protein
MVSLEEEYDKKLAELKAYIQNLKNKADAGDIDASLRLMALQFQVAQAQGKKCPDGYFEIMDGKGNPTNNFRMM